MNKTEQVANLRKTRASRTQAASKPAKKATPKKAKAAKAPRQKAAAAAPKGVRPGSKLETIVKLLKRDGGCTTKDVLKATEWPAVSMPQQARAAGLKLSKEKRDGVTYYSAA